MRWLLVIAALLPSVASAQAPGKGEDGAAGPGFRTPSGNIHCVADGGAVTCQIATYTYRPPLPRGDCELDFGSVVSLGPRGAARMGCVGDTIANDSRRVLPYGGTWRALGVNCTSAETGVRCRNGEGRGFDLSRTRLTLS